MCVYNTYVESINVINTLLKNILIYYYNTKNNCIMSNFMLTEW